MLLGKVDYIYELRAIVCYNLKLYPEALENINKALEINPLEERLKNNKRVIENMIGS